ncbi:MAG: oxidoreductase [Bacteroidia bacterium]|nr:MAG: oxidoreductase [Bacteroidia bacterium]
MKKLITRRTFLRTAAGAGLAVSALPRVSYASAPEALERRPLGSTGLQVTLLGLGCVAIGSGRLSSAEAEEIVHCCIDEGINYIDCASTYGDAEVKVGRVMKSRRKEVVLATKTLERGEEDAWREINTSMERLGTDRIDLLQIHSVNRLDELDRVTGKNGSLRAALRAQEQGMVTHIGITGHTRPEVIVEALKRYPFATVLAPLSSTDAVVNDFGALLFPIARERRVGVIAMKVLAAGRVTRYREESLRYSFSLPISTAIVGMGTKQEVRQNVATARAFKPMSAVEMKALEEKTRTFATTSVLWWKRR